jgi:hypothetical protein
MRSYLVYIFAAFLVIVGLMLRSNRLKARNIQGNVVVGKSSGPINQTYSGPAPARAAAPEVNWIDRGLVIAGVAIAAAQLMIEYHRK